MILAKIANRKILQKHKMFFLNLCHLFLDNEEDETTNVMDNDNNFASSFASEQLQEE